MIKFISKNANTKRESKSNEKDDTVIETKYPVPNILLVDIDKTTSDRLINDGYNLDNGTFGCMYKSNSNIEAAFNGNLPYLTERDIVIVDLKHDKFLEEVEKPKTIKCNEAKRQTIFIPKGQDYFNPRHFYAYNHNEGFTKLLNSGGVIIVFSSRLDNETYYYYDYVNGHYYQNTEEKIHNYEWLPTCPVINNCKEGKELYIDEENKDIGNSLLKNYNSQTFHYCTFHNLSENTSHMLFANKSKDNIGFIKVYNEKGIIIFLPQFEDKYTIIINLFKELLPIIKPNLFPYFAKNKWIESEEYLFPAVMEVIDRKNEIVKSFEEQLSEIEQKILAISEKFKCFTNILISEGFDDFLVDNIREILIYIGYKLVVDVDEIIEGKRQEDLRIMDNGQFTVVEVKGHSGNPTEDDCQALLKYINRNMKREKRTDIHGILIVNHQRILPPIERTNPAFSKEQIEDAERDGYTLVSTWQLFQSVRLLQESIITFNDIDIELHTAGLFNAMPRGFECIGKIEKLFNDKTIACVHLNISKIAVGGVIIIQDGNRYSKQIITEMMTNNKQVDIAYKGDPVSIKLDISISKNSNIYYKLN